MESDRDFLLRIRDRERKLIVKIWEALERIEMGTYGICEECGEEISEQRLMARPVATCALIARPCKERTNAGVENRRIRLGFFFRCV